MALARRLWRAARTAVGLALLGYAAAAALAALRGALGGWDALTPGPGDASRTDDGSTVHPPDGRRPVCLWCGWSRADERHRDPAECSYPGGCPAPDRHHLYRSPA